MGYTHYWERPKTIPKKAMEKIAADCKKVADYVQNELGIALASGTGEGEPKFNSESIYFNGSDLQPSGVWTTDEELCIPWPAPMASLSEVVADPVAQKTDGVWFAGNLVTQRVAPLGKNGHGSGSYETFHIPETFDPGEWQESRPEAKKGLFFECCKTAYRPYDLMVTAALLILKHHLPKVELGTDGEEKDWLDARILCHNLLGYGFDIKVGK
jgi:hypothetical protein